MYNIRPPKNADELKTIEQLQHATWGGANVTPHNTLRAWMHTGGIILGAFVNDDMIGFVAGFVGYVGGKLGQWSHIAAVRQEYQRQGIGRALKLAQQRAAREQGFKAIGWTYDPLRYANAIFNLNVLGARGVMLHPEHYGTMTDSLNVGRLSDRIEIHWPTTIEAQPKHTTIPASLNYVLRIHQSQPDIAKPTVASDQELYGLEIPTTFNEGAPSSMLIWYRAFRDASQPLFEQGYTLCGAHLNADQTRLTYIMQAEPIWYIYILRCADDSLYTGITKNIEKRLAAHNNGQGGKYTAPRRPVMLLAAWQTRGRSHASQLELHIKRQSRAAKMQLAEHKASLAGAQRIL